MFMTRSLNVRLKTAEQNLIVGRRIGKSEAELTNNKRLLEILYC